ncbi:unnamed protein product [marine sediment metagenome]|uniref:Uncharacterized protein n=1 Tax=marine sediment metagenome TaxID=412755 RepID=X1SPC9_9ZZZZ
MENLVITDFTAAEAAETEVDFPAGTPPIAAINWARLLHAPAAGGAHTEVDLVYTDPITADDQIRLIDKDTFGIRPAVAIEIHDTLHLNVVEVGEKVEIS